VINDYFARFNVKNNDNNPTFSDKMQRKNSPKSAGKTEEFEDY